MPKLFHEIRDPIHAFIRLDADERRVLDSAPLQRLRDIHQLGMSYLVYPGVTHKRFEHSLGVMELATRMYDVVTDARRLDGPVREMLPALGHEDQLMYWRRVLRMAALCHDTGHLPFSHVAEADLLPTGWNHERLTRELISSPEMEALWRDMTPPLRTEDIVKLALGPGSASDLDFTDWDVILTELITGSAFGADRIDYLLRDSHHAGVAYGRFDHHRLIDTMRILVSAEDTDGEPVAPTLGLEEGGLHSAEALLLARYFMFSQVYQHPIRLIYDEHLKEFLREWLPGGSFTTDHSDHLRLSDTSVLHALDEASADPAKKGHEQGGRIVQRGHFRMVYSRTPEDGQINPDAGTAIADALADMLGSDAVRHTRGSTGAAASPDFPVRTRDGSMSSSTAISAIMREFPVTTAEYVHVAPERREEARRWLDQNREDVLRSFIEEEDEPPPKKSSDS